MNEDDLVLLSLGYPTIPFPILAMITHSVVQLFYADNIRSAILFLDTLAMLDTT